MKDNKNGSAVQTHPYFVSYVPKGDDRGYDEVIEARDANEARKILRSIHKDVAYIADVFRLD